MSLRRKIDWMIAMRDLRHDRTSSGSRPLFNRALVAAQQARAVEEAAKQPLCSACGYDRGAIMRFAWAVARRERSARPNVAWRSLISSALKMVWARAKHAMRQLASSLDSSAAGTAVRGVRP
jgi:hypothetical protein